MAIHLLLQCSRCGARTLLCSMTDELQQQDVASAPYSDAARAWMQAHLDAPHPPDTSLRQWRRRQYERWMMGYIPKPPPYPWELVEVRDEE